MHVTSAFVTEKSAVKPAAGAEGQAGRALLCHMLSMWQHASLYNFKYSFCISKLNYNTITVYSAFSEACSTIQKMMIFVVREIISLCLSCESLGIQPHSSVLAAGTFTL